MTTKLKLKEPITWGSETIAELEIRKPKAKDLRGLPLQMGFGDMLKLAARCAGQPDPVIDELSIEDTTALLEVLGGFMGSSPATGLPH